MEKEEAKGKTESVDGNVDDGDLTAKEKWLLTFARRVLNVLALLTPTAIYGWGEDGWWKALLFTTLYVVARIYFKCAMAVTVFGSIPDAVEELYSEDKDIREKAENSFMEETMMPMITFSAFVIVSFGLSHLVGCN